MLLAAAVLQDDFQLQARAQPRENVATGVYDYSPGYLPLSLGPKPADGLASALPPPLAPCPLSSRPRPQRCTPPDGRHDAPRPALNLNPT